MIKVIKSAFTRTKGTRAPFGEMDTIETWYQFLMFKWGYKIKRTYLPPENMNCRCVHVELEGEIQGVSKDE